MMDYPISYKNIRIDEVQYNRNTGLFFFSPRLRIDNDLVSQLKLSVAETGFWQPIIVRAKTLEGVSGNHRYLALREYAIQNDQDLNTFHIPAMIIDCDEDMALFIALTENEIRQDISQIERIKRIFNLAQKKPHKTRKVLNVDEETVKQLSLWENRIFPEPQPHRTKLGIDRNWMNILNRILGKHPKLREFVLVKMRNPTWVFQHTLDSFTESVLKLLLDSGKHFSETETWNTTPCEKCMGNNPSYQDIKSAIKSDQDVPINSFGEVENACPYLRIRISTPKVGLEVM